MLLIIDLLKLLARFYNFNFFMLILSGLYKTSAFSNVSYWKVLMNRVIRMTSTDCKQYSYYALAVEQSQPLLYIALSHIPECITLSHFHSSANAYQPYSFPFFICLSDCNSIIFFFFLGFLYYLLLSFYCPSFL